MRSETRGGKHWLMNETQHTGTGTITRPRKCKDNTGKHPRATAKTPTANCPGNTGGRNPSPQKTPEQNKNHLCLWLVRLERGHLEATLDRKLGICVEGEKRGGDWIEMVLNVHSFGSRGGKCEVVQKAGK